MTTIVADTATNGVGTTVTRTSATDTATAATVGGIALPVGIVMRVTDGTAVGIATDFAGRRRGRVMRATTIGTAIRIAGGPITVTIGVGNRE